LQAAVQARKGAILARYNGADFAIFLPSISLEHARVTLQGCFTAVASLNTFTDGALVDAIHIGMTFDSQPQQLAGMLAEADAALRNAQSGGHSNAYFLVHADNQNHLTDIIKQASDWKHILERAIEDQQVIFHFQQVSRCQTDSHWQRSYMSASRWRTRSFKPAYLCRWPNVSTC